MHDIFEAVLLGIFSLGIILGMLLVVVVCFVKIVDILTGDDY